MRNLYLVAIVNHKGSSLLVNRRNAFRHARFLVKTHDVTVDIWTAPASTFAGGTSFGIDAPTFIAQATRIAVIDKNGYASRGREHAPRYGMAHHTIRYFQKQSRELNLYSGIRTTGFLTSSLAQLATIEARRIGHDAIMAAASHTTLEMRALLSTGSVTL